VQTQLQKINNNNNNNNHCSGQYAHLQLEDFFTPKLNHPVETGK
jgi:hypothetical protein